MMSYEINDVERVLGRAMLGIKQYYLDEGLGRDISYEVGFNYAGSKSVVVGSGTVLWQDLLNAANTEETIRRNMKHTVWDMLEGLGVDFLFAIAAPGTVMNVRVQGQFLRDMKVLMEEWDRLTVVTVVPFNSEVPLLSACTMALPAWLSLEVPPAMVRGMLSTDLIHSVVASSPDETNVDWRDTLARTVKL